METASDRKVDITKKIMELNDNSALDRIEEILAETETVAYTVEGEPLNLDQYRKRIETISNEVQTGSKVHSSEDVRAYVKNRRL
jgi:hypothetical protein